MIDWPNVTVSGHQELGLKPEEPQRSKCVLGFIPVIYYSILLCIGVPVNILTLVALSRLASRTRRPLYLHLLAVTGSDLLSQVFIVFVGFLLEPAIFPPRPPRHHPPQPPPLLLRAVSAAQFAANHAAVWSAVPLTVDRYVALCHPLLHRRVGHPGAARRAIAVVTATALASGAPFFWWSDVWREATPPTPRDAALIWTHVTIIYFLPVALFLALNSLIVRRLRRRLWRPEGGAAGGEGGGGGGGKSTAMLLAVTTAFAVLWAPRAAVVLYHLHAAQVHGDWRVHLAYDLANMLAMLNTALNFFLYCFVSEPFRRAVRDAVMLRPRRRRPRQRAPPSPPPAVAHGDHGDHGDHASSSSLWRRDSAPKSPRQAGKPS
ncbi:LOW QUALITY PROTEIN: putative G-protein coupled receptor 142 [Menidia menidia]